MESKKSKGTHILRLDPGEEIIKTIADYCEKEKVICASIHGIGSSNQAILTFFDAKKKKYNEQQLRGDYEICPLNGNITTMEGKIYLHCHATMAGKDFKALGGHVKQAFVGATFEAIITEIKAEVERKLSDDVGLNLLNFE